MAANIFISYSSLNSEAATRLAAFLENHGHLCWIAQRDEVAGLDYRELIMTALKSARIILLLLSQSACDSPEVENEVTQATRERKMILPVQLEPVALKPSMDFSLRRFHWHDARQGLTEWTLGRILATVELHLHSQADQDHVADEAREVANRAHAGDREAQFAMALRAESQDGAEPNFIEAVNWFRKSAESGHAEAAYRLALHLHEGTGVLRNEDAALTWFAAAARLGHLQAQTVFANELLLGTRTHADPHLALFWFEKAAQGGSVDAQFQAGVLLENGRGGTRDYVRAVHWLERAAESGHAGAQYLLASLLLEGRGCSTNVSAARHWALLASDQGHLGARHLLSRFPADNLVKS